MKRYFKINNKGVIETNKPENLTEGYMVPFMFLSPANFTTQDEVWTVIDDDNKEWEVFQAMYKPDEFVEAITVFNNEERLSNLEKQEEQIYSKKENFKYDTKEFTLENLLVLYENEEIVGESITKMNETKIDTVFSSGFIEKIILGIPLQPLWLFEIEQTGAFVKEEDYFLYKIIKNKYYFKGIIEFLNNNLRLTRLKLLPILNGKTFDELSSSRQKKILRTSIRTHVFSKFEQFEEN